MCCNCGAHHILRMALFKYVLLLDNDLVINSRLDHDPVDMMVKELTSRHMDMFYADEDWR